MLWMEQLRPVEEKGFTSKSHSTPMEKPEFGIFLKGSSPLGSIVYCDVEAEEGQ